MAQLTGRPLRYFLTLALLTEERVLTVSELDALLRRAGIEVVGRPSKAISDALRWERGRGRVVRVGPGRYGAGAVPESTQRFMRSLLEGWTAAAQASGRVVGAGRSQRVDGPSITITIPESERSRRPYAQQPERRTPPRTSRRGEIRSV